MVAMPKSQHERKHLSAFFARLLSCSDSISLCTHLAVINIFQRILIDQTYCYHMQNCIITHPCTSGNSWKRFSLSDGHGAGGVELAPLNTLTYLLTYYTLVVK